MSNFLNDYSQHSFERAKRWLANLRENGEPNVVISLAGNKVDLRLRREVSAEVGFPFFLFLFFFSIPIWFKMGSLCSLSILRLEFAVFAIC